MAPPAGEEAWTTSNDGHCIEIRKEAMRVAPYGVAHNCLRSAASKMSGYEVLRR
jgi:hypothetical protein